MRSRFLMFIGFASLPLLSNSALAEWKTACNEQRCQLFREIVDNNNQIQSRIYFQSSQSQGAVNASSPRVIAVTTVPLGIYLPAGIHVKVDDRQINAELVDCTAEQGCRAAFEVDPATLEALKAGKQLSLAVVDQRNQRTVTFNFELVGFSKAYGEFLNKL